MRSSASSITTEFPRMTWKCVSTLAHEPSKDASYFLVKTYHHAQSDLLAALLLLHGVVQDDVQVDLVARQCLLGDRNDRNRLTS